MRRFTDLEIKIQEWKSMLEGLQIPAPLTGNLHPREALLPLGNLLRRLQEGPRAPVRIAFFGPTGAGKSKLFNSLLGQALSPAGYRRPCTREAVYYLHRSLSSIAAKLQGKVELHERSEWSAQIFIDTPDFDGVEEHNRQIAERIYLEADLFLFITDIHKYADAATWRYLDRLRQEGKRCLLVINKVKEADDSTGPAVDFRRRLQAAFGPNFDAESLVPIGDHPQDDAGLIPDEDAGFQRLRRRLRDLPGKPGEDSRPVLVESFRLDLERFFEAWNRLEKPLKDFREGIRRLREKLESSMSLHQEKLAGLLESQLDPALKEEVYQEMLRRLDRIDFLRYPRKLLSMPVQGARQLLGRFIPALAPRSAKEKASQDEQQAQDRNFPAVKSVVLDFTDEAIQAFAQDPGTLGPLDETVKRGLRLEPAELEGLYRSRQLAYREWVEDQARQTAATLTGEHKLKFIVSQLIYNSVVIGVQIKTAGALSLTEILADGVLSPLVAKAVGMAISSEQVSAFELAARKRHGQLLSEVLETARQRLDMHLSSQSVNLSWLDAVSEEIAQHHRQREAFIEGFRTEVAS